VSEWTWFRPRIVGCRARDITSDRFVRHIVQRKLSIQAALRLGVLVAFGGPGLESLHRGGGGGEREVMGSRDNLTVSFMRGPINVDGGGGAVQRVD